MIKIRLYVQVIFFLGYSSAFGQVNNAIFNGGPDDGFDVLAVTQASNNNIFSGGPGYGFDVLCFKQASNNGIYGGDSGDGFDVLCLMQTSNNSIYGGGGGDGFDVLCLEQTSNNTIYGGGPGDGFDNLCLAQTSNNSIYGGGPGDGFDILCLEQISNNSIYGGGAGDGYDVLCIEQTSNNSIYGGGPGDGYVQNCAIVGGAPLPVEFIVFDGELLNEDEALLHWVVGTEINNAFFVLERSIDARTFEEVAVIASLGNTTSTREYIYKDYIRPLYGNPVVYYRLMQVDIDESFEYTHVIALNLPTQIEQQEYLLYPNPARERVFIRYANAKTDQVQVELYDNLGRQLLLETISALNLEVGHPIDLYRLPEGSYHIRIIDGDYVSTKTFMKTGP
ncbi:MAG: T9SS type A sorting domain-containing protein [Bacteroidota bacterium]